MGSRIMHAIIAQKIANRLAILDRPSFLVGGIAADATSNKDASHFFTGDAQDFSRTVDYSGFIEKYRDQANDPYVLGYYAHLIADDIWLKGFYLPWLKNRMEANAEIAALYHQDFRLLNAKLVTYYGIKEELRAELAGPAVIFELEEVNGSDLTFFIPYALADLEFDDAAIQEKLQVFTFEQIIGYIETSVDVAIVKIKQLLEVKSV